jgi:hypothetical protein
MPTHKEVKFEESALPDEEEEVHSVHDDPADESLANLTKILVDKNRSLLEDNQIDIEIFQSLEIEEQYEVID